MTVIRIHENPPASRRHRHLGNAVQITAHTYSNGDDSGFYHEAVARRLRHSYATMRHAGMTAAAARRVVADTVFALHMSKATAYIVPAVVEAVAS